MSQSIDVNDGTSFGDDVDDDKVSFGEMAIQVSKIINKLENLNWESNENNDAAGDGAGDGDCDDDNLYNFLNVDPLRNDQVILAIEKLFLSDNSHREELFSYLNLDEIGSISIISHSLSIYMQVMDGELFKAVNLKMSTDLNAWLSRIFRLSDDYQSFLHLNSMDSIVQLSRYLFSLKFKHYSTNGNQSFQKCNPIIYVNSSHSNSIYGHVCHQLGIPLSSIHYVPSLTNYEYLNAMNLNELRKLITDDLSNGDCPLLVIAECGVHSTGHVDNLEELSDLCNTYGIWLHLKGNALAALSLPLNFNREVISNFRVCTHTLKTPNIFKSATLSIGSWLGIPGLPLLTFYKHDTVEFESNIDRILPGAYTHKVYLPMWTALQTLGYNKMHSRIQSLFIYVVQFWKIINHFEQFRILSPKPKETYNDVTYLVNHETNAMNLLNAAVTTVVFQYIPETHDNDSVNGVSDNIDRLNSWLWSTLQIELPKFPLEMCNLNEIGLSLKFCPFNNVLPLNMTDDDFGQLTNFFEQQLIILKTTIENKSNLKKSIEKSNVLRYVDLKDWVGLGGVRYVPEDWENLLTDRAKIELNDLNQKLIEILKATDSAFSMGLSVDDFVCIRFGMLTPQSDIEELLDLVIKFGKSVEENSKVLETMSELVKKGIEAATEDLQKENDEKLWQEGLLRHIPVVGSFVNWWAPISNESGVRGRSLNLREGVIESTENIYRYHIQTNPVNSSPDTSSTNGCYPSPEVQKPLSVLISSNHRRTDSRTSNQSLKILESN